jgi:3-oxoacyl-[acyl-carrier protein] reductase
MSAMDLGLQDSVYVVSGGSRGLGRATAEVLVAEGARVVVSGRDGHAALATAAALRTDRALGIAADLADPGAAERLVASAVARFGRIDGALISTGGPPAGPADAGTDDQWRVAFESVFLGPARLARAVARAVRDGQGSIVLVLSSSVKQPIPGLALSNGLRPGLAMLAKTMAEELGPRGVRVNGLLPGRIATDRARELDAARSAAEVQRMRAFVPLGREGTPAEFGRIAAFLLSPASSYVTGAMLPVDGGMVRSL